MQMRSSRALKALWALVPAAAALMAGQAQALPSFARQTGSDCAACHIGAFGPQLTPYGIKFKLGGYVDSDGKAGKLPLSGMVVLDYNKFKEFRDTDAKDQTDLVSKSKAGLAEASIFLAGKLADHLGSFIQVTHDGVGHSTAIDQADLRYTGTANVSGQETLLGVSVNNNPTVQDPFNTLAVWSFPYTDSARIGDKAFGPGYPGVGALSGEDQQRVIGINGYALLNDSIYAELGLYNSISPAMQSRLGLGRYQDPKADPLVSFPSLSNAPYIRLAYMKDLHTSAFNIGLLSFNGTLKDRETGDMSSKFKDFGIDGSYQFLGNREHVYTVNGSWMRESLTDAADTKTSTKSLRLAGSYHFQNTYGATVGYFKASGADIDGNDVANSGYIYQADWTPWGKENSWNAPLANLRLGLQYTRFNSAAGIDKPSDLNSLRVFAWTSF